MTTALLLRHRSKLGRHVAVKRETALRIRTVTEEPVPNAVWNLDTAATRTARKLLAKKGWSVRSLSHLAGPIASNAGKRKRTLAMKIPCVAMSSSYARAEIASLVVKTRKLAATRWDRSQSRIDAPTALTAVMTTTHALHARARVMNAATRLLAVGKMIMNLSVLTMARALINVVCCLCSRWNYPFKKQNVTLVLTNNSLSILNHSSMRRSWGACVRCRLQCLR